MMPEETNDPQKQKVEPAEPYEELEAEPVKKGMKRGARESDDSKAGRRSAGAPEKP